MFIIDTIDLEDGDGYNDDDDETQDMCDGHPEKLLIPNTVKDDKQKHIFSTNITHRQ